MEALEDKYTKRDSFDEVDRILTIVEESRRDFEKADKTYSYFMFALFIIMLINVGALLYLFVKGDTMGLSVQTINQENTLSSIFYCLISVFGIFIIFRLNKVFEARKKKKEEFLDTTAQAIEVIREIIPVLARSEHWSVLRKFELRLRLSRLGISTETIFGPEM